MRKPVSKVIEPARVISLWRTQKTPCVTYGAEVAAVGADPVTGSERAEQPVSVSAIAHSTANAGRRRTPDATVNANPAPTAAARRLRIRRMRRAGYIPRAQAADQAAGRVIVTAKIGAFRTVNLNPYAARRPTRDARRSL